MEESCHQNEVTARRPGGLFKSGKTEPENGALMGGLFGAPEGKTVADIAIATSKTAIKRKLGGPSLNTALEEFETIKT